MTLAKERRAALSIQTFSSTEAGAWSNSYLISGESDAMLFDVFMLRRDASQLADGIARSGKTLKAVMISHAHPDHFMGLDVITERFPDATVVSTESVVADVKADGPWMFSMLQGKLGPDGPTQLVIPKVLNGPTLHVEGSEVRIIEFEECESKHIAALYVPGLKAFLSADLIYNEAHLYLQERHLESWLARLDELEAFATDQVSIIYPGHGKAAGLDLISQNRTYLREFASAVRGGDAKMALERMLAKYPDYHVRQFLTAFSIPAYFPPANSS